MAQVMFGSKIVEFEGGLRAIDGRNSFLDPWKKLVDFVFGIFASQQWQSNGEPQPSM